MAEMPKQADGTITEQGHVDWNSRAAEFMQPGADTTKTLHWKKPLEPNAESVRALDQSIRAGTMGGLSLASFRATSAPRALLPSEERYFIEASACPNKFAVDIGCKKRSCVRNAVTGTRRFEATWTEPRRLLQDTLDQGSIGEVGRCYLFQACGLRGFLNSTCSIVGAIIGWAMSSRQGPKQ
jgi:hypothetical protein